MSLKRYVEGTLLAERLISVLEKNLATTTSKHVGAPRPLIGSMIGFDQCSTQNGSVGKLELRGTSCQLGEMNLAIE